MLSTLLDQFDAWISAWGVFPSGIALGIVTGVCIGITSSSLLFLRSINAHLNKSIDLLDISNSVLLLSKIARKSEKIIARLQELITLFEQVKLHHPQAAEEEAQNINDLRESNYELLTEVLAKARSAQIILQNELKALEKGQSLSKEDKDNMAALDLPKLQRDLRERKASVKEATKDIVVVLKEILNEPPEVEETQSAAPPKSGTVLTSLKEGAAVLFGFSREVSSPKTPPTTQLLITDKTVRVRPSGRTH